MVVMWLYIRVYINRNIVMGLKGFDVNCWVYKGWGKVKIFGCGVREGVVGKLGIFIWSKMDGGVGGGGKERIGCGNDVIY